MRAPCMECDQRGCGVYHDECPKYQEFRRQKMEEYAKRKEVSHGRPSFNHPYSTSIRRRQKSR